MSSPSEQIQELLTVSVSDCFQLTSGVQRNISGSYYKQSDSVYARLDQQFYFYLSYDPMFNAFWSISPIAESPQVIMVSYDLTATPLPPTQWLTYDGTSFVNEVINATQTCTGKFRIHLLTCFSPVCIL